MPAVPLSVLFWMPRAASITGGHVVQLRETAAALKRLDVMVALETTSEVDLSEVDIVHGFGLLASEIHDCRSRGALVALSTIYWDRSFRKSGPPSRLTLRQVAGRVRRGTRLATAALQGEAARTEASWRELESEVAAAASFAAADCLLPNAAGEARSLIADFDVSTPMTVVPNGVDPTRFPLGTGPRDGVLYAGRIDPHKNQLGLIRALAGTGVALTIAGPPHPHHPEYYEACLRAGRGWVEFTGGLTHDELAPLYRSAKVHVLPTWFETTGLVSLEAAMSGCEIVTTSRGHAREYFADLAWYCDPDDPASIRSSVEQALAGPSRNARLREHIAQRYTWDHVAEATLAAYERLRPRTAGK